MNLWELVGIWLKGRLKVHPHALKGAPGEHDEAAAADHVNGVVGALIDAQVAAHSGTGLGDFPNPEPQPPNPETGN